MNQHVDISYIDRPEHLMTLPFCGVHLLQMAIAQEGDLLPLLKLAAQAELTQAGTMPYGMSKVFLDNGLNVDYISANKRFDNNHHAFDEDLQRICTHYQFAQKQNSFINDLFARDRFHFIQKEPTLQDITDYLHQEKPVIAALDVQILEQQQAPFGAHYIMVVGEDDDCFYIHNSWPKNNPNERVSKDRFEEAWSAHGWTKDLIIGYND